MGVPLAWYDIARIGICSIGAWISTWWVEEETWYIGRIIAYNETRSDDVIGPELEENGSKYKHMDGQFQILFSDDTVVWLSRWGSINFTHGRDTYLLGKNKELNSLPKSWNTKSIKEGLIKHTRGFSDENTKSLYRSASSTTSKEEDLSRWPPFIADTKLLNNCLHQARRQTKLSNT